ncbi:MAG: metallopeptidase family protein, partial [Lacisediminihabitans sp.]
MAGIDPKEVSGEQFEKLVIAELDLLPDEMVEGLENVSFTTEDRPEDGSLHLLGLNHGIALTHREHYGYGELPDRITLYRLPLLSISRDLDDLRDHI